MRAFITLARYWRLLARYLGPHRFWMLALGSIVAATICVQIATPLIAGRFIDRAVGGAPVRQLIYLTLLTTGLAIGAKVLTVAESYVAENISWSATNALRLDLVGHLLRLDPTFHAAHTPGELIERVDGDVDTLARFFSRSIVYLLGNSVLILGVLALLIRIEWRIGLALSAFVLCALVIALWIRARATTAWAAERQASADFYGYLGENLAGLEDIRSSGATPYVLHRTATRMRTWLGVSINAGMRGYAMVASSTGLFGLGTAAVLAISVMRYQSGAISIGTVYLIYRFTDMLQQPTEQIRDEVQDLQQADASIGRIATLLGTQPELTDGAGAALPDGPLSVQFDNVSFGYRTETIVLHDLNVSIAPGHVLGVIGRTGSGKSTLTRLLTRLYDPMRGVVRLGGVDLRTVSLAAIRSRVGLVSQDIHLFNASLRDNLTIFDTTVPDCALEAALQSVGLETWASNLSHGLDTVLVSGAEGLSAGQAQLLACARVFLTDPDVLILDEPSSRLDPATERLVHAALEKLLVGRTGIIVAHRLSIIELADDVLVLEDGRIREYGPRIVLGADPESRYAELLTLSAAGVNM